ncbi:MAG TPA: OB-fold domain-containing protein [Steroidobacteraceae bacterium]|nr:OB-fold domain-containing protein [Steroidobacteraceae bacterium]
MPGPLGHLVACGAHVAQLRLPRARIREAMGWLDPPATRAVVGARAVCNWDEDSLTLAVEAARNCLSAARPVEVGAVTLASTTLPFADRSNATVLAGALDLPSAIQTLDVTGTLRGGVTALVQAARRADGVQTLVVAADARAAKPGSAQELEFGAGAAAFVVCPDSRPPPAGSVLAVIHAAAQVSADFVDHYRMSGESFDYTLEERWVRDEGFAKLVPAAIDELLRSAGLAAVDVHHCILPGNAATVKKIVQSAGLTNARLQDNLRADCGDTGTAHPLLMLVGALEAAAPGDNILLVGFGQGAEALLLRAPAPLPQRPLSQALQRRKEETSYTRYLSHSNLLAVDFGMRAERDNRSAHSAAWRKHRQITGFIGGKCTSCGTVQFPRSRVCVNPECRKADTQSDFKLSDTNGRVKTFTEDWQAYSPRPPSVYGNIEFEPGGNLLMELTDIQTGELHVGDPVRFVFRIKDVDRVRGFRRYFWKAVKI